MADLTDFKKEMCDKYTQDTNRALNQLTRLYTKTRGPYNEVARALRNLKSLPTTPTNILNGAIRDLGKQVTNSIPDLSDATDLNNMMKACTQFKDLMDGEGSLTDAVNSVVSATTSIVNQVFSDAITGIMSGISEFASGAAMKAMDDIFSSLKVPNVLGKLDGLINCIEGMCPGSSTQSIINSTNRLQNDMGFDDNGNFDSASIMSKVGMPTDKTANLTSIQTSMTSFETSATQNIEKQVNTIFENTKKAKKEPYISKISSYF